TTRKSAGRNNDINDPGGDCTVQQFDARGHRRAEFDTPVGRDPQYGVHAHGGGYRGPVVTGDEQSGCGGVRVRGVTRDDGDRRRAACGPTGARVEDVVVALVLPLE